MPGTRTCFDGELRRGKPIFPTFFAHLDKGNIFIITKDNILWITLVSFLLIFGYLRGAVEQTRHGQFERFGAHDLRRTALSCAAGTAETWSRSSSCWATARFRPPDTTWVRSRRSPSPSTMPSGRKVRGNRSGWKAIAWIACAPRPGRLNKKFDY